MKKIVLVLCCCCLLPLQTHAQIWGLIKSAGKAGAKKSAATTVTKAGAATFNRNLPKQTRRVSIVLERRAAESYRRAAQAQAQVERVGAKFPHAYRPKAVEGVALGEHRGVSALEVAQQTHPQPYLQGTSARIERNMASFIQAENNRLFTQFANSIKAREERLPEILRDLQIQTHQIGMPENSTRWLAEQVPTGTDVLVVGEGFFHNPSTIDATSAFLTELRQRMPEREMILLTFPLKKDVVWTPKLNTADVQYYPVGRDPFYKDVYENGIEIIGLGDERFVTYEIDLLATSPQGYEQSYFWMYSYEAMQQQSTLLMEKVAAVKAEHPNALIILHVRQEQASYDMPFSVASRLAKTEKNLYAVAINSQTSVRLYDSFPEEATQELTTRTTLFEQMFADAHLPDVGVVSRGLAKDVGADAWIKVPFDENKTDTGIYGMY